MRIIFVRHGEPDYTNDSLTEKGKREAELLAKRSAHWNVKDIYVSPMGRAKETAAPTLKALNMSAEEIPWLREFSYQVKSPTHGENSVPWDFIPSHLYADKRMISVDEWINIDPMNGNPKISENYPVVINGIDELLKKYGYIRNGSYYLREDGRERYIKSTVRDHKFATVDDLPAGDSEPTIVLFCHLGVTCLIMSHLLNIPFELLTHGLFLPTTSLTILNTEERWGNEVSFRAQAIGDVAHLLTASEPISNAGSFAQVFQK